MLHAPEARAAASPPVDESVFDANFVAAAATDTIAELDACTNESHRQLHLQRPALVWSHFFS